MPHRRRLACVVALAVLSGCASEPQRPLGRGDLLDFLSPGATSRADVYLRVGPPGRTFENGRIATWRLATDEGGYFLVSTMGGWRGTRYELVVVFGADDILQRHSLVEIRAP